MTALRRKLVRDLWHLRGQVSAIALVVACGIATVVTTHTSYDSLLRAQQAYYASHRFADVFASLERAPDALARRLAAIPGVAALETRLVYDVTLDVPGLAEPASGRLVSIPERGEPLLNALYLRRGRWIEPGRRSEVIVSEAFANANGLHPGDAIGAVLNGRWERLRIVGLALSPEYVYEIRPGDLMPDPRRFGVVWMSRAALGPALDLDGAFNDVALTLAPGASEEGVIVALDRRLERYGGLGAYGRRDQVSNRFVSDEIAQNRVSGVIVPTIFLGVAAFLLHVVLRRLVATQRDQIAVLKAFGYPDFAVARHYVELALVAVVAGSVVGLAVGTKLGQGIHALYAEFYRFPAMRFSLGADTVALGAGVAAAAALLGAAGAVRGVLRLPPAEAMRPEAPARYRRGRLDAVRVWRRVPVGVRMLLRNLARRPGRAALSTLGIALAVALLVVGRFFFDAIDTLAERQFRIVQRDDVSVIFHRALSPEVRHAVAELPGVLRSEVFRAVPVRLRAAHRTRRVALLGLAPGTEMRRLVDDSLGTITLPPDGLVLTRRLGEVLGVAPGDRLTVDVLEGERRTEALPVVGLVDELIGFSAYLDERALAHLVREDRTVSGAWLRVDDAALPRLHAELKRMPAVGGVMPRKVALASFAATIARTSGIFTQVLIGFACVIAFGVVYNAARIALAERGHELASLRVLGFTRGEVTFLLLGEQALQVLAAIPLGLLLGRATAAWIASAYQWELFRLPAGVSSRTDVFAAAIVVAASVASAAVVARRLARFDLVSVLKARE